MIHRPRRTAFALLVALAISVVAPPVLHALERSPVIAFAPGYEPAPPPTQPQLTTDAGDPDEWASKSDQGMSGAQGDKSDGSGVKWLDYLRSLRGLVAGIKLQLEGIL